MDFASFIFSNAFILLFFPIWVAFLITLNFTVPSFRSKHFTINLTLISTGICGIYSIILLYLTSFMRMNINETFFDWLRIGNASLEFGFLLDNLSAFFLVLYTIISFIIQLYSYDLMKKDECFHRYFVYLNLLSFAISGLIVSPNLIQTFLFLSLSSAFSYLLISFWYKKKTVSIMSKRAFLISRFGDCCLFLGIIFIVYFAFNYFPSFDSSSLNFANLFDLGQNIIPYASDEGFAIICTILFLGIMVKGLQIPFHVKALNTIEAPVPVLALVNTFVGIFSGVLLLARFLPIFNLSAFVINFIFIVSLITAFIMAVFACFQTNIKKVFLYLSCSQAGLIYSVIILSQISTGLLCLTTFIMSVILMYFLTGIICDICGTENMIYMGNLRIKQPFLAVLYVIGITSFSGLFFSGLFSMMRVLNVFLYSDIKLGLCIILPIIFLTAYACFRTYFSVFEGIESDSKILESSDIKEGLLTKISFVSLAFLTVITGLLVNKSYSEMFDAIPKTEFSMKLLWILILVCATGGLAAFIMYKINFISKLIPDFVKKILEEGFYIEKICFVWLEKIYKFFCKLLSYFDEYIVKGTVKLLGYIVKIFAVGVSKSRSGSVQMYLISSLVGIIFAILLVIFYYLSIKGI